MVKMLLTFIAGMFEPVSRTSELDKYLTSRDPKSIAEVEHFITEFDQIAGGRGLWWR